MCQPSLVGVTSGKVKQVRFLISSHQRIWCLSVAAVVWNTSVIDTVDLILSTCVVKPDCHSEDDGLGISHSVTHR